MAMHGMLWRPLAWLLSCVVAAAPAGAASTSCAADALSRGVHSAAQDSVSLLQSRMNRNMSAAQSQAIRLNVSIVNGTRDAGEKGSKQEGRNPLASAATMLSHLAPVSAQLGLIGSNCSYYTGSYGQEKAPFDFWRGVQADDHPAQPVCSQGLGIFIFPSATCGEQEDGSMDQCCSQADWSKSDIADQLVSYGGPAILIAFIVQMRKSVGQAASSSDMQVWWKKYLLYTGIISYTVVLTMMAQLTQGWLSVSDRNAMLAASAFLTPVRDAFQFLEDSVSVQIGFALASGNTEAAMSILILGVMGGFLFGILGAAAMTALLFWPSAIRFLLAPSSVMDAATLPHCTLVDSAAKIVEQAHVYWLLTVWSWPLAFAGMALIGYMFGTRRIAVYGLSLALSSLSGLGIFVVFQPKTLSLMGWANFVPSLVTVLVCGTPVILAPEARAAIRPALNRLLGEDAQQDGVRNRALRDGALAMALELSTQLSITIGVYVGSSSGVSTQYQLSALQAALPKYSTAMSFAVGFVAKMRGSYLVGARSFEEFHKLVLLMAAAALALASLALISVLPHREALAFDFAENACEFATSEACAPAYIGIFGGGTGEAGTLQTSFGFFAVVAASMVVFNIARSGLYACQDFFFLGVSGIASLLFVFVPAIWYAHWVVGTPAAIFAAMYAPSVVLAVVFSARLYLNTRRMLAGADDILQVPIVSDG